MLSARTSEINPLLPKTPEQTLLLSKNIGSPSHEAKTNFSYPNIYSS